MNGVRVSVASLLMCLGGVSTAASQTIEAGATIALSCIGSDGSFCNETHSDLRTAGPFASIWFNDFIEVSGRVAWLDKPDLTGTLGRLAPSSFLVSDRERTIGQAEVIWHFRREERVRVMFGLGLGRYWESQLVTCEPVPCDAALATAGLIAGRNHKSQLDRSILVGVSAAVLPRLRIRAGWRYHNPLNDENALSEVFVGAGYQLTTF
jgi:hypothetical protein